MSLSQAKSTTNRQRGPYDLDVEATPGQRHDCVAGVEGSSLKSDNRPNTTKGRRAVDISDLLQRHSLPFSFFVFGQVHQAHRITFLSRSAAVAARSGVEGMSRAPSKEK
jgi:hypothetical protein